MASAAATLLLLLAAAASLPPADAIPPEIIGVLFAQIRGGVAALDYVFWARAIGREVREKLCGEKGRRRPLDFPLTFQADLANPVGLKHGANKVDALVWGLHVSGRATQDELCYAYKMRQAGRDCCCCRSSLLRSRRCCCCGN